MQSARASVGPLAENLSHNDFLMAHQTRNLSPQQFHTLPVRAGMPGLDNGWLGPLGSYGQMNSGGYAGYGVSTYTPMGP